MISSVNSENPGNNLILSFKRSVQDILRIRPCCNTIEVSNSFFTRNRAWLIILIHASKTIWIYKTRSSSKINNISPSVPTGVEELDKYTGQNWKHWNVQIGSRKNMCNNHLSVFDSISMQMRNRHLTWQLSIAEETEKYNSMQPRLAVKKRQYVSSNSSNKTIQSTLPYTAPDQINILICPKDMWHMAFEI